VQAIGEPKGLLLMRQSRISLKRAKKDTLLNTCRHNPDEESVKNEFHPNFVSEEGLRAIVKKQGKRSGHEPGDCIIVNDKKFPVTRTCLRTKTQSRVNEFVRKPPLAMSRSGTLHMFTMTK